jgi:MFS transporter, PHS family, inorganic phosphate transporter
MQIFALFMLLGMFTSFLIPETKRKTLEQLAGEIPGTPEYDPELAGIRTQTKGAQSEKTVVAPEERENPER